MQIHVNTDHHIAGHEPLAARVRSAVERALSHFSAHITRVDVHLSDENGDKRGRDDKRCVMEALLAFRRAGADGILTYFAVDAAERLKAQAR